MPLVALRVVGFKAYRRPALAAHESCKVTPRHARPFSSRSHVETVPSLPDVKVYPLFPPRCPLLLVFPSLYLCLSDVFALSQDSCLSGWLIILRYEYYIE